jgi:putative sigma-54 modulation protein
MQIHLSPRHLRLTAAIHQRTAEKIESLEGLTDEIVAAHVVLVHSDAAKANDRYSVKVHLALPGPDVFGEACADDLYVALDLVTDQMARQLRKRKTRLKDKGRSKAQKAERARRTGVT